MDSLRSAVVARYLRRRGHKLQDAHWTAVWAARARASVVFQRSFSAWAQRDVESRTAAATNQGRQPMPETVIPRTDSGKSKRGLARILGILAFALVSSLFTVATQQPASAEINDGPYAASQANPDVYCNANLDAYGRYTGTGNIIVATDYVRTAPRMAAPRLYKMSYTPVLYKWTKNTTTGYWHWKETSRLPEVRRTSSTTGVWQYMPPEQTQWTINQRGHYKVYMWFRWYRPDGVRVKSAAEWTYMEEQYWPAGGLNTGFEAVAYCTF